MALDQSLLDAIKGFEGYAPHASWDYKQMSSGYGTRAQPGDENIPPDQLRAVYEQRFQDAVGKAAASVDQFAPNLPAGARAALTSLTYNAGPGWQQSGLGEAVRSGDYNKAHDIFLQYNKAGGDVNPALVARRQKEASWFGGGLPRTGQVPSAAPQSPATGIPAQPAPVFAQQPQAAQQSAGSGFFAQMPAQQIQQAPIQFARPRTPDLTKLRADLARPPIFSRQG